jgi:hypothetical protein
VYIAVISSKISTAANCPFLPFDDDYETSAFFSNPNNINAKQSGYGTKYLFDINK